MPSEEPTARLGDVARALGDLLAAQHAVLAQEAFPLPTADQSGDMESTEEGEEDEEDGDSVGDSSRSSGAAVETKAEGGRDGASGEGGGEGGHGRTLGTGSDAGGEEDAAAEQGVGRGSGVESSTPAPPATELPVAQGGAAEEDGEGEEETGHLTALPMDFVSPPAGHARARTAPSGARRLAQQDVAPDRTERWRRPGTQGASKAGQQAAGAAASEGGSRDDPLASLPLVSRGEEKEGLLSVSQSRLLAFSRPHTRLGAAPEAEVGDLLAWGHDEVEDLGLVDNPEELSEWWSEVREKRGPRRLGPLPAALTQRGDAGGAAVPALGGLQLAVRRGRAREQR